MRIKFNSDNDLPLNKSLKFHLMTITIRCVFKEDNELYPQVFLDDTLHEIQKWWNTKESIFLEKMMLIRHINKKNVSFAIIGIFYIIVLVWTIYVMIAIIFLKNLEILLLFILKKYIQNLFFMHE